MEDWKWRLQDVLEKYSNNGIKNIEEYSEVCEVVEQELSKAREEQFTKKELKRIGELLGFMLSDYPSTYWKPEDKSIGELLSKLKDNK